MEIDAVSARRVLAELLDGEPLGPHNPQLELAADGTVSIRSALCGLADDEVVLCDLQFADNPAAAWLGEATADEVDALLDAWCEYLGEMAGSRAGPAA